MNKTEKMEGAASQVAMSVIVPVYNTRAYLEECVRSVESQTFTDFELLLIDDGSTDGSGALCDSLSRQDARIRVVHQKNQGRSAVRNNGVDMARGEYVLFIDSDDFTEPEMFAEMVGAARQNDADVVMCRYNMMDHRHNILSTHGDTGRRVISSLDATAMVMKDREIRSYLWNKLIRRSVFDGVRFPADRNYEDMATVYRLIDRANKVVAIPYVGYNYVRHPESITQTPVYTAQWVENQVDVIKVWQDRLFYVKADERLARLVPFCAGKTYHKCLRVLDSCYRHDVFIPQDQLHDIVQCMKTMEDGNLRHVTWKFRRKIWIVKSRLVVCHAMRTIKGHKRAKSSLSLALATVRVRKRAAWLPF